MIYDILQNLKNNSSRLAKESILKQEKDNELLKSVFFHAYNPLLQFYIRKIPDYTPISSISDSESLEWGIKQLKFLSDRTYTGHAGVDHLQKILMSLTENDAKVIELIIGKDLKCGASESTANKIWKDLIPEFPCMLASGYSDKLVSKIKFPAITDLKSDGMRCSAIVTKTSVKFFSRSGKEMNLLGNIEPELLKLHQGEDFVIDGELMVWDEFEYQFMSRKEGNGILNKANKGTISPEEASRICFVVWDYIPLDKFNSGVWKMEYIFRRELLMRRINEHCANSTKVKFIDTQWVNSLEDARKVFTNYLEKGLEGIILKDKDGIWEDKRSKSLIKFKAEFECDLLVSHIEEGTGKYEGKIGSLQCTDLSGKLIVGVGTGLSDYDRSLPFSEYIGKIISVKYNEIIVNDKGEYSLFLPVFIEIRHDKTEPDKLV